ncbi:hypothetical protein [Nocardia asteroides]|uniref:hypothetical protein n=1 Tax=Nocardia asteroides TaxID=1824 RepID=UPI0033D3858C
MTDDSGDRVGLGRRIAVALLVCATGLLTLLAVVAGYVRAELLDTDHYVDTMAPLAEDPAVQSAVADALTRAVMGRLDVESATAELLESVERENRRPAVQAILRSLPALVADETEDLVRDASNALVHSDGFPRLWTAANRQAHRALVAAMTGKDEGAVRIGTDGVVTLSLEPMLTEVATRLENRGFAMADRLTGLRSEFVLIESEELAKAQRVVRLLDRLAIVLGVAALGCAIGAVLVADRTRRRRAILYVAVSVLVSMVVLGVALVVARTIYLDHLPVRETSIDAARVVFDTLAEPLRTSMRVLAVLAALVAFAAFLAGPSKPAVRVRAGADRLLDRVRRGERGPVSRFVTANIGWLRYTVLILAAAVFVFWDYPTVRVGILIAAGAAVALLILDVLGRPRSSDQRI